MIQKEITINGKKYPVIFTLATLFNFEEITEKPFFGADFDILKNRIDIICAAAIAADENTELTVKELRGKETWEDYVQIANAYVVVMELATQFFPKSKKDDEKPEAEGEDKQKN